MRGCFVTGTDTGVGKTVVAAAICAGLRARGERVAAYKPVITGTDEPPDPAWPPDDELLAAAAGTSPNAVTSVRFGPPASPHLAAALAGQTLEPTELVDGARAGAIAADVTVVEGVGGLLVPLTLGYSVRDFARDLGLPLVVASRPGLGTISHTLLTVEAARALGLEVRAIVMTPWPAEPSPIEADNRETVQRLAGVATHTLATLPSGDPSGLAQAASALPLQDWVQTR